jgi:hypothetical protein
MNTPVSLSSFHSVVVLQKMNLLKYILTFYLLLLSVVPCCAFDSCPDDKAEAARETGRHKSGDEDNCGNCSPFFNCESCASVTINSDIIYHTAPVPEEKRVYTDFIPPLIPDVHYDFWQPPKLG